MCYFQYKMLLRGKGGVRDHIHFFDDSDTEFSALSHGDNEKLLSRSVFLQ